MRGSITKERAWWDVKYYHLNIKVNPADSTITGSNTIKYQVVQEYNSMQIDLQNLLSKNVDLVSARGLSKYVKPILDKEKKLIYAR